MYSNFQKGPQGVQNDRASGSKYSNRTGFNPFYSATEKIYSKYFRRIKNRTYPFIRVEPTHGEFCFPVTVDDIRSAIKRIPRQYVLGIKAILVPPGSKKQTKAANSLYLYGEYWQSCIFLHPMPKSMLRMKFAGNLKPNQGEEYRRAGAKVSTTGSVTEIEFNADSLRNFYLNDVLVHEVGHHVDRQIRTQSKREGFASWFASEYGFKVNL